MSVTSGVDDKKEDGKTEAVKTYIEQTKLLVTLASAFVLAPAGLVAVFKDRTAAGLSSSQLVWFVAANVFFIASVLMGYVVLGTIAGYQHLNKFDVYRPATMYCSLIQIATYLFGLAVFIVLAFALVSSVSAVAPKEMKCQPNLPIHIHKSSTCVANFMIVWQL